MLMSCHASLLRSGSLSMVPSRKASRCSCTALLARTALVPQAYSA